MPSHTKLPLAGIAIQYTSGAVSDLGDCKTATQAHSVIQELGRVLARMAAREDDAKENGA